MARGEVPLLFLVVVDREGEISDTAGRRELRHIQKGEQSH